jgi:hypothetical protein
VDDLGDYVAVRNQTDFQAFCYTVDNLHDGLVREAAIIARGYVDSNFLMWGDTQPFDMRLIIQLQWEEAPCVDLILEGVTTCRMVQAATDLEPDVEFTEEGLSLFLAGKHREEDSVIVAEQMKYRFLSQDWLGTRLLAVREFPRPDILK